MSFLGPPMSHLRGEGLRHLGSAPEPGRRGPAKAMGSMLALPGGPAGNAAANRQRSVDPLRREVHPEEMRAPRRLRPSTRWFITVRCMRAQYRLRPDIARTHAFGYFLGRALAAHSGVRLFAAVQMSNHLHLVLEDQHGRLDRFMAQLLSPLAKALNAMDELRGQVWERRYSAIEILDDEALVDRIAYTLTNPAAANLVDDVHHWPGLLLGPGGTTFGEYTRFRKPAFDRARYAGLDVEEKDFTETVHILVDSGPEAAAEAVQARVEALRRGRTGPVLGVADVLKQRPLDAPKRSKRSPAPLCHTAHLGTWLAFRDAWKAFVANYRAASKAFRDGALETPFPDWTFRPSIPHLGG